MSATHVYGGGSTPSPLPPIGEPPLAPPSASPGPGIPGKPTESVPSPSPLSGDGGTLPLTGVDLLAWAVVLAALLLLALGCAVRAKSNRAGDR